jgi:hypothetical protein
MNNSKEITGVHVGVQLLHRCWVDELTEQCTLTWSQRWCKPARKQGCTRGLGPWKYKSKSLNKITCMLTTYWQFIWHILCHVSLEVCRKVLIALLSNFAELFQGDSRTSQHLVNCRVMDGDKAISLCKAGQLVKKPVWTSSRKYWRSSMLKVRGQPM